MDDAPKFRLVSELTDEERARSRPGAFGLVWIAPEPMPKPRLVPIPQRDLSSTDRCLTPEEAGAYRLYLREEPRD